MIPTNTDPTNMAHNYTVKQGDSLTSIAFDFGFRWEMLWNHPNNADLKNDRKDPHVIYPGDILYIPDRAPRFERRPTDAKHQFVRKSTPDKLRIQLLKDLQPRPNLPYTLVVDGKSSGGTTDGNGLLEEWISPGAKSAKLVIDGCKEEYPVSLGYIDPIDTVSGLQGRLQNLGYYAGQVNGSMDDETREAVRAFQAAAGLPEGDSDDATQAHLKSDYGC
jgi:hypothetical protein